MPSKEHTNSESKKPFEIKHFPGKDVQAHIDEHGELPTATPTTSDEQGFEWLVNNEIAKAFMGAFDSHCTEAIVAAHQKALSEAVLKERNHLIRVFDKSKAEAEVALLKELKREAHYVKPTTESERGWNAGVANFVESIDEELKQRGVEL